MGVLALGIGPGDEVMSFIHLGYHGPLRGVRRGPRRLLRHRPTTFNLNTEALSAAVTTRTRAIVAVHLFGLAADMQAVSQVAQRHKLAVIEDAACAVGSTYQGRPVGGLGSWAVSRSTRAR